MTLFLCSSVLKGKRERERKTVLSGERKTALSRATSACFLGIQKHRNRGVSLMMNVRPTGNPFSPSFEEPSPYLFPTFVERALLFDRVTHTVSGTYWVSIKGD